MLHGYKIDPQKGMLTAIGKWPTEKTPRGFNIDPRGKFLLDRFSEPDRPCNRPEQRRAKERQAISDGQAAELGRDRR
jgi:Lactonase, 7-bladed beta-propeller